MGRGHVTGRWKNNGHKAEDGLTDRQREFAAEQAETSRQLDELHRANHPERYNPDGTVK